MKRFEALSAAFNSRFETTHFPAAPANLYDPADYFLSLGGKRIRPVMCLLGNELFGPLQEDAWTIGNALELFHNFTLIHDDIMDRAPLRRGEPTVHIRYGEASALLAGDVMLVRAYEYLNQTSTETLRQVLQLFNRTGKEVCEGQQLDMDFEKTDQVSLSAYLRMIELKTAVLLAVSLQLGAIAGGAKVGDQNHLYAFGINLGMAYQVQDDYLDAFGDPLKFGKQPGGDILANKKTFLLLKAMESANSSQRAAIDLLLQTDHSGKVDAMLKIYADCRVDQAAREAKEVYMTAAAQALQSIDVPSADKEPLRELAGYLLQRDF